MKKVLCLLLAVMTLGCIAGCKDHDDEVCDNCGKEDAFLNRVVRWEDDQELCMECAAKKYGEDFVNQMKDQIPPYDD